MKLTFTNLFIIIAVTLALFVFGQNYIHDLDHPKTPKHHIIDQTGIIANTGPVAQVPAPAPITPPPAPIAINGFISNGTEPFWAANFSGSTMVFQNPDIGIINITGIVGPTILTGGVYIRNEPSTSTLINLTIQPCTNGMSEQVFSGSIAISVSGTVYNGCAIF